MALYAQEMVLGPFFEGGSLQGGAQLYAYSAGTTTAKDIYADRDKATPLAQPLVADSQGIFSFFADGLYKFVVVGPQSTSPSIDVLYTWDEFLVQDFTNPTFAEGAAIPSASTVAIGPEIWAHITGSVAIAQFTGSVPFFWAVFDGALTLTHSTDLILPESQNRKTRPGEVGFFLREDTDTYRLAGYWLPGKQTQVASAATITGPTHGSFIDVSGVVDLTGITTQYAGYEFLARFTNAAGLNFINSATFVCPFGTDYRVVQNEIVKFLQVDTTTFVVIPMAGAPHLEPGMAMPGWFTTAPVGGLLMTGAAINATTYQGLSRKLIPTASTLGNTSTSVGNITATAATDVLSLTAHGLSVNDLVHFTNSGGALPTGISANTVYYVLTVPSVDTFTISTTRGGSVVDITGAGSGTNTVHNKVNLPDMRGRNIIALDNLGGSAASVVTSASTNGANSTQLGGKGGAQTHTLTTAEMPAHTHEENSSDGNSTVSDGFGALPWGIAPKGNDNSLAGGAVNTDSTGGGGAHSTTDPWMAWGNAIRF